MPNIVINIYAIVFNIFHIVESISIMAEQFQKRYTSGMYPAHVPENVQT